MADLYANYAELSAVEVLGKDYVINSKKIKNAKSIIFTPHGGSIEAGASELVKEVAKGYHNWYEFAGIKSSNNTSLHITSTNFDEPTALAMIGEATHAMSIHGYGDSANAHTEVGGLDQELVDIVIQELTKEGFSASVASGGIAGLEPTNISNRTTRGMGVQLELSTLQRQNFFTNNDFSSSNRGNTTETFKRYARALRRAMNKSNATFPFSRVKGGEQTENLSSKIDIISSYKVNIKKYEKVAKANNYDWGIAINQALAELPNKKGTIIIPRGAYVVRTPIVLKRGQSIIGEGSDATYLNIQASTGVFITEQLVTMKDIAVSYGNAEYKHNFTGIDFSASRSYMDNVHVLSPKIGIRFNNASYYSLVNSLYIYNADQYGILFERSGGTTPAFDPNNHIVHLKHISGNAKKAGSIGIYIKEGAVNNIYGGEVQGFDTNIKIETHNNRFHGLYLEESNLDLEVTKDTNFIDIHSGTIKTTDQADIINMAGGYTQYFDLPPQRPSMKDLKALYLFNEGSGNIVRDYSGNHKDATVTGGTWTSGLYGTALQLDSLTGEKVSIPNNVIDPTKPYTFAILFNTQAVNLGNNMPLFLFDGAKYLRFQRTGDFKTSILAYDGTTTTQKDLNNSMSTRIDKWAWFFMTYDPVSGVLKSLDPVNNLETTIANPLSTLSSIDIHRSNGTGNSWVAKYNMVAFWQRALTKSEARQFINSVQPIIPVNSLMRKPKNSGGSVQTYGSGGNVVNVTFPIPENDTNYFISITQTGKTAGAPAGARVESITKTKTGFSFTLNQAPTTDNGYYFDWVLTRN